jgi:LPS sulfotransferase NodH
VARLFCVLTTQRSGSTWLMDLLNRRPDIEAKGEIFLRRPNSEIRDSNPFLSHLRPREGILEFCASRGVSPDSLGITDIREFIWSTRETSAENFFFTLMYDQFWSSRGLRELVYKEATVLHLVRSEVDSAISGLKMAATGVAHISGNNQPIFRNTVQIDGFVVLWRALKILKRRLVTRVALAWSRSHVITVRYERLCSDPDEQMNTIERALGLTTENVNRPSEAVTKRLSSAPQISSVSRARWLVKVARSLRIVQ